MKNKNSFEEWIQAHLNMEEPNPFYQDVLQKKEALNPIEQSIIESKVLNIHNGIIRKGVPFWMKRITPEAWYEMNCIAVQLEAMMKIAFEGRDVDVVDVTLYTLAYMYIFDAVLKGLPDADE